MKIHHRLIPSAAILCFAAGASAAERPFANPTSEARLERIEAAALERANEQSEARLEEVQRSIAARLDAELGAAVDAQLASRFSHQWAGPPVPARPLPKLPARRATRLADAGEETGVEVEGAKTAARARADQEPFGG